MQNLVRKYVEKFMHEKTARRKAASVTLVLALVVTAGVYWQFKLTGAALANDYSCGQEEHTHTDECYESILICESDEAEGHVHTDACYEKQLVCGLAEHTHTAECLSDSTADVETASDWEDTVPSQTGAWSELVVAAAQSQIGYQESTLNYILADDGVTKNGYTRYGEWAGNPYGDWDAMFVSFCLHYAGVSTEEFPESIGAYAWSVDLQDMDLYADAAEYIPSAGDLVFFDTDEDGKIDRVGIIAELMAADEADAEEDASDKDVISVIEGNYEDAVCLNEYAIDDETILGYGMLPEDETAVPVVERETTLTYEGSDYSVTVTYNWEAGLPDGVELVVTEYEHGSETWLTRYAEAAALYGWDSGDAEETDDVGTDSAKEDDHEFRLFNISLFADGEEVEPAADVRVSITYIGKDAAEDYTVTHFGEEAEECSDAESGYEDGSQTITFDADEFSDYGTSLAAANGSVEYITINLHDTETVDVTSDNTGSISIEAETGKENGLTVAAQSGYKVVTSITSGESYYIVNTNGGAVFLGDTETTSSGTSGLTCITDTGGGIVTTSDGTYISADTSALGTAWTFTASNNGYTIFNGTQYLNFANTYNTYGSNVTMGNNSQNLTVSLVSGESYYTISRSYTDNRGNTNYNYLNRYSTTFAAGYGTGGSGDQNNCWYICETESAGIVCMTFYADETGTYTVTCGDTTYIVTVTGSVATDANVITNTASTAGTVINLFDYWVDDDYWDTENDLADTTTYSLLNSGINKDHALKFFNGTMNTATYGAINANALTQGIVSSVLIDGYPSVRSDGSLYANSSATSESLAYLFNPNVTNDYKNSYTNTTGLLQIDSDGYYYYDSTQNYAEFDTETKAFTLYDDYGVYANWISGLDGQFFPFNRASTVSESTNALVEYYNGTSLNHWFGMTLTTRFIQQNGGHETSSASSAETTFYFAGDDDVWIYIDGVLVADVGGTHGIESVTINFATGAITYSSSTATTIKAMFTAAGEEDSAEWSGNTFADNTYHTLSFYYLERGGWASDIVLKYNLTQIPETGIFKVNQYGDPVEGAEFAVYQGYKDSDDEYYYLLDSGVSSSTAAALKTALGLDEDIGMDSASGQYVISSSALTGLPKSADGGNLTGIVFIDSATGNICYGSTDNVIITARYFGTTDAAGEMIFYDDLGGYYSIKELYDMFGDAFILKEISVPDGYRIVSEDIWLRFAGSGTNIVIVCDNTYDSGVYASSTLMVTATDTLYASSESTTITLPGNSSAGANVGDAISYHVTDNSSNTVNGTLFAVVLKYVGNGDPSTDTSASSWAPVYGSDMDGYTVMDSSTESIIQRAIVAAQNMESNGYSSSAFSLSASNAMTVTLTALPGDISTYYYMLDNAEKSSTKYTVAYYWTSASSLNEATGENTVRVESDAGTVTNGGSAVNYEGFTRTFGATISVPNLKNALLVQKLDSKTGELVNGAVFALYSVEEVNGTGSGESTIYYVGTDSSGGSVLIYLGPDDGSSDDTGTAGDNQGIAWLSEDSDTKGTYVIDSSTGIITVTIDGSTYTITPKEVETTAAADSAQNSTFGLTEDGTAVFTNLTSSTYYVREISAPGGYTLNPTEVMVLVTGDTIYANAGTAEDGITVARAPGYVVATLDQFAVEGEIDNTLTWIYTRLSVNTSESNTFNFSQDTLDATLWSLISDIAYLKYQTDTDDASDSIFNYVVNEARSSAEGYTGTRRLYTDVGWASIAVYQDGDQGDKSGYNYTELTGEITNLFSRSTYIQVSDEPATISLKKVSSEADTNGTYTTILSGAKFVLYKIETSDDGSGTETETKFYYTYTGTGTTGYSWEALNDGEDASTYTTDSNGLIEFYLSDGTYYIEEITAPEDYVLLTGTIKLVIENGVISSVTYSDSNGSEVADVVSILESDTTTTTDDLTVLVKNTPVFELPSTGGPGTRMLTLIGIALCGGAIFCGGAGWLFCRRRRRFQ